MLFLDTLKNFVTGLGTAKDKSVSTAFHLEVIQDDQLNAMHRSDWLARKIVDIIPNDMTREWRNWQSDGDDIELIEGVEKAPTINLQLKLNLALQKARLLRGSTIYMGMRDRTPERDLNVEAVGKDELLYLHVLGRNEVTCGEINRDVTSEFYGEPTYYEVRGNNGNTARVHPSRMIRFVGAPILDEAQSLQDGWGDSVLQIVYSAIMNAASAQAHVAALIPEAKADVIYIPGLSKYLENETTTAKLTARFTYANTIKSMFNMVLLEGDGKDAGEKWEQKAVDFNQLPELMQQFIQIAAAAADIPITRLLGESPGGLSATGESDLHNYYDNIAARQNTELSPALHRLDEVIIRSATGKRDETTYYEWAPLWGMSDKEKAEVFKIKADAVRVLAGAGGEIIPIEALSDAMVNTIVEDGSLPGLETAIEEYGKLSEQEPDPAEQAAALALAGGAVPGALPPPSKPSAAANNNANLRQAANDAAPQTLYVRRDVMNTAEIVRWARSQGFTDIVPDLHVTIAYSRTPVDWFKVGSSWTETLEIVAGGPRQMERLGPDGKYYALLITANELVWRHEEIIRAGASWEWPDYQPHISIQIGGNVDLLTIVPYQGKIVLGPEIFEKVKED